MKRNESVSPESIEARQWEDRANVSEKLLIKAKVEFSTNKFSPPFLAEKFPGSFGTTGCWDKHRLFGTDRAIYVKPSHENARTNQEQQTNRNRAIWLVYRTDTNVGGFCLVEQTLFMPEELSRNQPILNFDVILQHDWPIEQCLLHIRVSLAGKRRGHVLKSFIHWVMKQITNTYRNHFSRSYENRRRWRFEDSSHVCNLAAKLA